MSNPLLNNTEPIQDEDKLKQKVTDICFENGGVSKPMVDQIMQLIKQQQQAYADKLVADTYYNLAREIERRPLKSNKWWLIYCWDMWRSVGRIPYQYNRATIPRKKRRAKLSNNQEGEK